MTNWRGKPGSSVIALGAGIAAIVLVLFLALTGQFGTEASDPVAGAPARGANESGAGPVGPPAPAGLNRSPGPLAGQAVSGTLRYDNEYPTIDYAGAPLTGRLGDLERRLAAGSVAIEGDTPREFLASLLAALEIDPSSQMLVFSKTSLQVAEVTPQTPRAIYFNDDTYVAFVTGSEQFEIASIDPALGPVFHTITRRNGDDAALMRETARCLRCHDSLSLTGGGVPRLLLGSGYIGTDGELVSHEAWILMRPWTPLKSRWGGWYVSGTHGEQVHLGNIVVQDIDSLQDLEALRVGNRRNLGSLLDTSPYLTPYSDIVALLIAQHQLQVQNDIARLNWDLLTAAGVGVHDDLTAALEQLPAEELDAILLKDAEPLIETLVMAFDVELTDPVEGTSGYTEWFESQGIADEAGRSLRELDLTTRIFRYPLSYLIHSPTFDGMPAQVKAFIYRRVREELTGGGRLELERIFPAADRAAALEILAATKPEFSAATD